MNKTSLLCLLPMTLLFCHPRVDGLRLRLQVMQWPTGSIQDTPIYYQPNALLLDRAALAIRAWPEPRMYLALFHIQSNKVRRIWPADAASGIREKESPAEWPSRSLRGKEKFTQGPDFVLAIASRTPLSEAYCQAEGLPCQTESLSDESLWKKLKSADECKLPALISFHSTSKSQESSGDRSPNDPKGGDPPPPGGKKPWVELSGDIATFAKVSQTSSAPVQLCVKLVSGKTSED